MKGDQYLTLNYPALFPAISSLISPCYRYVSNPSQPIVESETPYHRGKRLIGWLETERKAAVAIHLDDLASKMQGPGVKANPTPQIPVKNTSTELGLLSNTNLAQGVDTRGEGGQGRGRIEVTTQQQAKEVTEKRKKNLEAKSLNLCPLCKQQHFYERTWEKLSPPFKTEMMSTHLDSCPKFKAMSGEERVRTVTAQSACLVCTAWDHTRHRVKGGPPVTGDPKCKFQVAGSMCGQKHGRWYHDVSSVSSHTGNVLTGHAEAPEQEARSVSNDEEAAITLSTGTKEQGIMKYAWSPSLYEVFAANIGSDVEKPVSTEDYHSIPGMVMVDPGSDTDFIHQGFAEELGLQGEPVTCYLKVVNNEYRKVPTMK